MHAVGHLLVFVALISVAPCRAGVIQPQDDGAKWVDYTGFETNEYTYEKLTSQELIDWPNEEFEENATDDSDRSLTESATEIQLEKATETLPESATDTLTESATENLTEPPEVESGNATKSSRILGGAAATAGRFGYYAYIVGTKADATTVSCGGAILSETWVLTGAQCVATAATIAVYAGLIAPPAMTDVAVAGRAYIHPRFVMNYMIHDVALVRLLSPLTLSGTISTIKLSRKCNPTLDNVSVRIMGMGLDTNVLEPGTALNYVDVKVVNRKVCDANTKEIYVTYHATTGCLDVDSATKNFCWADRGGPVVYTFDVSPVLIGLLSQYQACPSAYPSSYTKIGPYVGWIKATTGKDFS